MDQIVDQKYWDHARNDALTICHGELIAAAQQTYSNAVKMVASVSFK